MVQVFSGRVFGGWVFSAVVGRSVGNLICYAKILKESFRVDLALSCIANICFETENEYFHIYLLQNDYPLQEA